MKIVSPSRASLKMLLCLGGNGCACGSLNVGNDGDCDGNCDGDRGNCDGYLW